MMTDEDVRSVRPLVQKFVRAVHGCDRSVMDSCSVELNHRFGVIGGQALAVLTAGMVLEHAGAVKRLQDQVARLTDDCLVQRRKVTELNNIRSDQAAHIARLRAEINEHKAAAKAARKDAK